MTSTSTSTVAAQPDSPARLAVTRLALTDFRCYRSLRLAFDGRPVSLTGPNGAGKTNLLEALSFLAPGRGLRRARLGEVGRRSLESNSEDEAGDVVAWAVSATVATAHDTIEIGTGIAPGITTE